MKKAKPKTQRLSSHEARQRLATIGMRFRHVGGAPQELTDAWDRSLKSIVLNRRVFTPQEWKIIESTGGTSGERGKLKYQIIQEAFRHCDPRTVAFHCPPWTGELGDSDATSTVFPIVWSRVKSIELERRVCYVFGDRLSFKVGEDRYPVAWSFHAVIQAIDRLGGDNAGNRFLLAKLMKSLTIQTDRTGKGFWIWVNGFECPYASAVVRAIHGQEVEPSLYGARIAYCPVDIRGGTHAVASTMLSVAMAKNIGNAGLTSVANVLAGYPRSIEELQRINRGTRLTKFLDWTKTVKKENPVFKAALKQVKPHLVK